MDCILAFDAGTTSNRAIIFTQHGDVLGTASKELKQHFPHDGWVEHDPHDIFNDLITSAKDAIAKASIESNQISAVGLTNQRETTIVWDRKTSQPVYNAIVWQDRRTAQICEDLKERGLEGIFTDKTGLLLDPYFSGTKIRWILDQIPDGQKRADNGELAFGTVDSWIAWKLSNGKSHIIDATNASRTLLFNVDDQCWDSELLGLLNIPNSVLPEVVDCAGELCEIEPEHLGMRLKLTGIAGDQHAALIGQACLKEGMVKSTYGTGCFMMVNCGKSRKKSSQRLLSTMAYRLDGEATFALEGAIFNVGTSIQWLRDEIGLFDDVSQTSQLAESAKQDDDLFMVPAFTGLGAPWWDPDARGLLCGITRDTNQKDIIRAALDACGYQTADLIYAMESDSQQVTALRIDGGMVKNEWLCQRLADLTGVPIERAAQPETTALGAALLAAVGVGAFANIDEAAASWKSSARFEPRLETNHRLNLHKRWSLAVRRASLK